MGIKIKPQNLSDAFLHELRQYKDGVDDSIASAVDKAANQAKNTLRASSPKLTGDYRRGWRVRLVTEKKGRFVKEVQNKTDYQLTHVLEHGHAKTGGGMVPAVVHIQPVEEQAADQLERLIKEALE